MLRSATLISYPVGTDEGGDTRTVSYRPPLGLLLVADQLEALNVKVRIVDLALEWIKYQDTADTAVSFAAAMAESLAQHDSDFFGFSSIAGTMPLSVRIAQLLRPQIRGRAQIGFGGPGASSVAKELLLNIEDIDFVLSGEVEGALAEFVRLYGTPEMQKCPNLVWRDCKSGRSEIVCNDKAPLPDDFPQPNLKRWSYDVGLPVLPIELGRGCPYACQFCSTKDFFGRAYRLKPIPTLLAELRVLLGNSSALGLEFVHDLFTVNRKLVLKICDAILSSKLRFSWSCSSHINCTSPELIERMAQAGCRSIFFGIESGSKTMQRHIRKNIDLDKVLPTAIECAKNGISFNYGVIIGFPEERYEDLRDTTNLIVDLLSIHETLPAIGILSPIGGTEYSQKHLSELLLDTIPTKVAFQGSEYRKDEFDLIQEYPSVFPEFYHFPSKSIPREELKYLEDFFTGAHQRVRFVLVAMRRVVPDFLGFCRDWFVHVGRAKLSRARAGYYTTWQFKEEFVSFCRGYLADRPMECRERQFIEGVLQCYDVPLEALQRKSSSDLPALASGVAVRRAPISLRRFPLFLDRRLPIPADVFIEVAYLHVVKDDKFKMIEIPQAAATVLDACDGESPEAKIIEECASDASDMAPPDVGAVIRHYSHLGIIRTGFVQ